MDSCTLELNLWPLILVRNVRKRHRMPLVFHGLLWSEFNMISVLKLCNLWCFFIIVNVLNSFSSLKNVPYLMNFKVYTYFLDHNLNQRTIAQCGCISNDCVIFLCTLDCDIDKPNSQQWPHIMTREVYKCCLNKTFHYTFFCPCTSLWYEMSQLLVHHQTNWFISFSIEL